jgi:hypothetical protein
MTKLINAHDLWSDIMMLPHNGDMISSEDVEQAIKDAPAIEVKEIVHGRWMPCGFGKEIMCSVCRCTLGDIWEYRHCPDCGAIMDMEE